MELYPTGISGTVALFSQVKGDFFRRIKVNTMNAPSMPSYYRNMSTKVYW